MNIPVLMYHQIDAPPPRGTPLRGLIVAPSSFAWQMRMLRLMGYRGLSMRELEPYIQGHKQGKVVGLTFDDGFQNNVQNALPILLRQRIHSHLLRRQQHDRRHQRLGPWQGGRKTLDDAARLAHLA